MEAIEALNTRATAKTYGDTAPTKEHLAIALQAAVRAPDHGRLRPWRFMLIEGDQRRDSVKCWRPLPSPHSALSEGDLQRERDKAARAAIIVVACRIVPGPRFGHRADPRAAGAAAQNILLALHTLGYVAAENR
jgi:nitroreductase